MGKNKYCVMCKQKISTNWLINLITKIKLYEFEDGTYCDKCAKFIVNKRRTGVMYING